MWNRLTLRTRFGMSCRVGGQRWDARPLTAWRQICVVLMSILDRWTGMRLGVLPCSERQLLDEPIDDGPRFLFGKTVKRVEARRRYDEAAGPSPCRRHIHG